MIKKESLEILVGLFVFLGICCICYMTIRLGKLDLFKTDEYTLEASFISIGGLKQKASVEIAGIQVGYVSNMYLDQEEQIAVVEIKIKNGIKISYDVIASIKTSGLVGDKYIQLSPGGSEEYLEDRGIITETESALDIEELISKYVFGGISKTK